MPYKISATALTAGVPLILATSATADPGDGPGGYYHHMWGDGYGFGFMGGGVMLISWIAIIVLIVIGVRWLTDREKPQNSTSSALETLKMRFARGEIDAEEYETRRKLLEG